MTLVLPHSLEGLEDLAAELSDLLDSVASGEIDAGPGLARMLVGVLEAVEARIQECSGGAASG